MSNRTSLVCPRSIAYSRQSGLCFYCNCPMWSGNLNEFVAKCGISISQAKALQCTGEHLKAHKDGGSSAPSNIVAACKFCNQGRHKRKKPPHPEHFKQIICKRMAKKSWHQIWVFQKVLPAFHLNWIAPCPVVSSYSPSVAQGQLLNVPMRSHYEVGIFC